MGKKFDEFVNKLDEDSKRAPKEFNPTKRIDKFRRLIQSLYSTIDEWLEKELLSQKIKTGEVPITISEEMLGSYQVDEKWIQIGNAKIIFQPIGTILIGTDARVDMIYRSKTIMIVRTGDDIEGPDDLIHFQEDGKPEPKKKGKGESVWKYVKANQRLSYVALNKETFQDLIINLVNG